MALDRDDDEEQHLDDDEEQLHNSDSDHNVDSKSQRGPTINSKGNKGKIIMTYNKRGVPTGSEAKKLATFEGMVARTMVPITYGSWLDVPKDIKDDLWQYTLTHFVLDPRSRKQVLQSVGSKWRQFKYYLNKKFIVPNKNKPKALSIPPRMYPCLKKADWKLFVSQKTSKKSEEQSKKAKNVRAKHIYNHHLSRKGYAGLISEIMEKTGKTEEEIDRATLWKKARQLNDGGYDQNVKAVVEKIDELQKTAPDSGELTETNDVLTQALGTGERRGHVRGMGKFVTPHQYFHVPRTGTVKHLLDIDERFNKLEAEIERLKNGTVVSEGASCQIGIEDDFGDEPLEESHDKSCLLAIDVASNIVAKGVLMNHDVFGENLQVLLEICLQEEALVPIPCEEDPSIIKVKDAVGYILTWPRHLVIRCVDLEKVTKKVKQIDYAKKRRLRDEENEKGKKGEAKKKDDKKTKEDKKEEKVMEGKKEEKEEGKDEEGNDEKVMEGKKEEKEVKGKKLVKQRRKMTRRQRKTRIRVEDNGVLRMTAIMVDGQVAKVDAIKVQCEDNLFGHDNFTYVSWDDFESVFALDELSGAVITSFMMYLYEQIKHGRKVDHGICFVSPSSISPLQLKAKPLNIDDASRSIARRLSTRGDNDIILLPYNPGNHWVLAVLDMKTLTCYYLDSLKTSTVNSQMKQTVNAAMVLYNTQSGSKKRPPKLNWVNARCPCQPGSTECGYYMLKFMKEIVEEGVEILANNKVGGDKEEYTEADLDSIREEWAGYVSNFIFR